MVNMLHFPVIDGMPDFPALPVPDYAHLNREFQKALMNPDNKVLRYAENGHPIFGAYIQSPSNEMVTWGILAIGAALCNQETDWIRVTYPDFFVEKTGLFMNSPGGMRQEHWYLFYVNTLAGAVKRALYEDDGQAKEWLGRSADGMLAMARKLDYDFNQQGYFFDQDRPFTHKDIYRQPDSIAGFAYNMLFAALQADRPQYLEESYQALLRYQSFPENPWYEIPNGSAGLMAAAWLNAHGHPLDVEKIAGWIFDPVQGPLQTGKWGGEEVDGLMMGWRGDTRAYAENSAYSMESLMPVQFLLPALRYAPRLSDAVGKYMRCLLSNFQLFYAMGQGPIQESKPHLDESIPYEKLSHEAEGHIPYAHGDFHGHRSVYGAGYLLWLEALARPTDDPEIFALDLSLTDWLADEKYPVFLLRNAADEEKQVSFSPAPVWEKLQPGLYREGALQAEIADLMENRPLGCQRGKITLSLPAHGLSIIALLPKGGKTETENGFIRYQNAKLMHI